MFSGRHETRQSVPTVCAAQLCSIKSTTRNKSWSPAWQKTNTMTVYPMESVPEVNISTTTLHIVFTDFQAGRVGQAKEDQDDIKRFLTFSDVEEDDETETKRKDSNFVTFARRMSCMVLGERGMDFWSRNINQISWVLTVQIPPDKGREVVVLQTRCWDPAGGRVSSLWTPATSWDWTWQPAVSLSRGRSHISQTFGSWARIKHYIDIRFSIYWTGVKCVRSVLGLPTAEPKEEAEREDVNPLEQLQDLCPTRPRPDSVLSLATKTGFTHTQIRRLYRGFKSECPSGILTEESFHKIYSTFFPGRELSYNDNLCSFTHYLYSLMDNKSQGFITFEVPISTTDCIY